MQEVKEALIYVDENGNDAQDGSKTAPLASVCGALSLLVNKDYERAVIIVSGSVTEVAAKNAMIDITDYTYPSIIFKGEDEEHKGILDASGLNKGVLFIGNDNTVTLGDHIILRGGYTKAASGAGVYIEEGTFIMEGGEITDNETQAGLCGGVYVGKDGAFIMRGGSIVHNTGPHGGGVCPDDGGIFTMYGGHISDNTAYVSGGGVFVGTEGTFVLYGGTIEDNIAGGEITISINGVKIPHGKGGGVYVCEQGVFTMYSGEIRNNRALSMSEKDDDSGAGGGVFVENTGIFTLEDGRIIRNGVMRYGGGVYIKNGHCTLRKGRISNNVARLGGGGVYVCGKKGRLVLEDVDIASNYAAMGGGVCTMDEGIFRMEGGGIFHNRGTVGSGLFMNTIAAMLGGIVAENDTKDAKAVVVGAAGKFIVAGGILDGEVQVLGQFDDIRTKQTPESKDDNP